MWLRDPRNHVASDDERIDITMSYIRGDKVNEWVQNYYNNHFDDDNEGWQCSWAEFKNDLNKAFLDSNKTRMAQEKLETLCQGANTAETFFQKFELLLGEAEYGRDSTYVIRLLEKALNVKIIDQIYGSNTSTPTTYDDWKDMIIGIDEMWSC